MIRTPILPERTGHTNFDNTLLSVLILTLGVGLAVLFSASYFRAELVFNDPYYFTKRQFLWAGLGAVAAAVCARLNLELIRKATPIVLAGSLVSMAVTLIPGVSPELMGARRWIVLAGFSIQPAEFAKPAMILYLAHILDKKADRLDDAANSLLPPALVVMIFAALVYLQNDFSTFVFFLGLGFLMFFMAGVKLRHFLVPILVVLPLAVGLVFTQAHRIRRLITFLEPNLDPSGAGFQVLASRLSLARGGLWGAGVGQGITKLGGLPEAHADFIFAVLGEEVGFFGVILVVGLFVVFASRGFAIAVTARSRYEAFLAFGLTACIAYQALLHVAVAAGVVPATGVTLPLFSSGGSSVLVTLIMGGLLLNISRSERF